MINIFGEPAVTWRSIERATLACSCAIFVAGCQSAAEVSPKEPLLVEAVNAEIGDFTSDITLTGEIQADVTSDLAFETSGQVLERFVDVGDRVEAGQVLARLTSSEQVADQGAAQVALEAAQSALEQANTTLDRQQNLLNRGLTTRSTYDAAVEAASTAGSGRDAAQATYDQAIEAIEQTELRAFASGTVTARAVEVGQVVQAGQPAFTVATDGPRKAIFEVDEQVLTDTFAAQNFVVRSTGEREVTATATLEEVSPTINPASGSVEITLALGSAPPEMSLGSVVTTSGQFLSQKAIVVPASALTWGDELPAVWVLDPDSHAASRRPIELAAFDTTSLVITAGVEAGELVVTSGANLLFPGQVARIKE